MPARWRRIPGEAVLPAWWAPCSVGRPDCVGHRQERLRLAAIDHEHHADHDVLRPALSRAARIVGTLVEQVLQRMFEVPQDWRVMDRLDVIDELQRRYGCLAAQRSAIARMSATRSAGGTPRGRRSPADLSIRTFLPVSRHRVRSMSPSIPPRERTISAGPMPKL